MPPRLINVPKEKPYRDVIAGDTTGPFIDTITDIRGYGRVYVSVGRIKELISELGYLTEEESEKLRNEVTKYREEIKELREVKANYQSIVSAVAEFVPQDTEEVEVVRVEYREPTDEDIEDWVERKGANHPLIREAKPPEKGSAEEWQMLYGDKANKKGKRRLSNQVQPSVVKDSVSVSKDADEEEPLNPQEPDSSATFTLHGQEIDLDKVLAENVGTIVEFAEGKSEDFQAALVVREWYLAEKGSREVRKGVLKAIGYWDEETDEPLYPMTEEEEAAEDEDEGEDE